MALYDGPRQITAGILAAILFLGLFFGLNLVWWLALVLAAVGYGALLLVIPHRRRADEIILTAKTSKADLQSAGEALSDSAKRLTDTITKLPKADATAVEEMAQRILSIRENILRDPEDYRLTRRFITTYLPNMVQTVETYAGLTGRTKGAQSDRLDALGAQIRAFAPVVDQIDRACIENDLAALESEVDALGTQLSRRMT